MQNEEGAATSAAAAIARAMIAAMRRELIDDDGAPPPPPPPGPPDDTISLFGENANLSAFLSTINPPATMPRGLMQTTNSVEVIINGAALDSPAAIKQAAQRGVLEAFRERGMS